MSRRTPRRTQSRSYSLTMKSPSGAGWWIAAAVLGLRATFSALHWTRMLAGLLVVAMLAAGRANSTEPAPEIQLEAISATSLTGTVGSDVTPVPEVRATSRAGHPVQGVSVSFALTGGGSIATKTTRTDRDGVASVGTWRFGEVVGAYTVTARSTSSAAVVFTAFACDSTCGLYQLAYARGGQIFRTNLLGHDATGLTADSSGPALHPAWSPDGRRLAFVRDHTLSGQRSLTGADLYLMDADGSNVVRRARGLHSPAWSPDGRRLAVTGNVCWYDCDM